MSTEIITKVINALPVVLRDEEREIVEIMVNGGKSDATEKAKDICNFMDCAGELYEMRVYRALTEHW